ncbi:MAG: DUF2868 domain-containing protein [Proteobacteria bacterium]|nr:DUF2868 domain-containing protein [Pseudomonadota bacterium]MBU1583310.1 DUF2868 domain-containing protein [Pseudomonadota bacterium]MBU2453677.1 DUF2868 domain-containing protein [Pseudomonadota bacterium]MBU2629569.1 DUF2868 domain-containing protein [Pseudomonadota bacterium]
MKIRLKDIIDLDYLISKDDALDSAEDIRLRAIKDRKIYTRCKDHCQTDNALLLSWLSYRKEEFFKEKNKKGLALLPGSIFSFLYTWSAYAMFFFGGLAGISLVYSFLAYHGTRPINVAVFIALFVMFQVVLIFFVLILLVQRAAGKKNRKSRFQNSILHTLLSALFFNVLPKILKKADWAIFRKSLDTLEYTSSLIRMKNREYKDLFFWPFVVLTSLFSLSFSAGALGGTFFRVVVSDMAFGWQSTLTTSSARIHDMVSFIATPWSWFMPLSLSHPTLSQIEGSRIVLKDGISVLATQDLVSWWPFICMGILFYAVIPRGLLLITGIYAQKRVLRNFNFKRPRFKQLIVRMQSPLMDIEADEPLGKTAVEHNPIKETMAVSLKQRTELPQGKALLLASKKIYADAAMEKIIHHIETSLFFTVKESIGITFDLEDDTTAVHQINNSDADQVILVHEVWQPPIRGLLHYITRIKAALPNGRSLWILLTGGAGPQDLLVTDKDLNFGVWKKAVLNLKDPDIIVKRIV